MEKPGENYINIGNELSRKNKEVVQSKMFGMATLKISGKAFCGLYKDDMVFKLNGEDHAQALALKGAKLFDPSDMGRPMKEWVIIPGRFSAQWPQFAAAALKYVAAVSIIKSTVKKAAVKKGK